MRVNTRNQQIDKNFFLDYVKCSFQTWEKLESMLAMQLYKPLIRSGHTLIFLKQYLALLKIQQVATKGN